MNIEKMSKLIMDNVEFLNSCYRRMSTSTHNKLLHDVMIHAIECSDRQHVEEALMNPFYRSPLHSVIVCMDVEYDLISEFLEAFEEIV